MTSTPREPQPSLTRHHPTLNCKTFLGELIAVCSIIVLTIAVVLSILNANGRFGLPDLDSYTIPLLLSLVALILTLDRLYARFEVWHALFVLRATLVICLLFFLFIVPREAGSFQDYCIYVPTLTGFLGAPASGLIAFAEFIQFLIRGLKQRATGYLGP